MADFLEERINQLIEYGSSWQDDYMVNITVTSGGQEYRSLVHAMPVRKFDISYMIDIPTMWTQLLNLYHRAHGRYSGFRARCYDEYSSNGAMGTPTAFDQAMSLISGSIFQLRKYYGLDAAAGASGYPYRNIYKPVSGTVKVGIGTTEIRSADWSVSNTTGQVTFVANKQMTTFTGISKAAQAVILCANTQGLVVGQSVHISGVTGMTQINGLRALITAVTTNVSITVAINSSAFSTWISGGTANTNPQSGEIATAGFEFDMPVRFDSSMPVTQNLPSARHMDAVTLVELLNP